MHILAKGFPDSSVSKESACNAGDPGSIPGSGRSPGEGIGYPLQYSGLENSMELHIHVYTMDCSLPGPSIHGIFQAKVLEWGAIAF